MAIDEKQKMIRYVSAGHNAPILLKTGFGINEIESPAPPISNWMSDFCYEEREIGFEKGDILVLLTDGITECSNSAGDRFGIERTESVLLQSRGAEDFIGKLKNALGVFPEAGSPMTLRRWRSIFDEKCEILTFYSHGFSPLRRALFGWCLGES